MAAPSPDIAVAVRGVSKRFRLHRGREVFTVKDLFVRGGRGRLFGGEELWAVRDVSLELARGRMVGIIGSNGSGKSTLLKLVGGILKPTSGSIAVAGRVSALIELGAGFHPEFTGRENIYVNGILLGLSRTEIRERFDEIVTFAGLDAFIDNPVKTYSSGMYMRLGFAIAVTVDPDILLIDEVLAVGDEAFQHKCVGKIQEFKARGKTIVLVTHDLGSVERLCDEAVWLHQGRLMAHGGTRQVIDGYLNHVASEEAQALGADHREAEAQAAAGTAQRWGSREVEITRVRLLDAAGAERYLYDAGEACTVHLDWRATATDRGPGVRDRRVPEGRRLLLRHQHRDRRAPSRQAGGGGRPRHGDPAAGPDRGRVPAGRRRPRPGRPPVRLPLPPLRLRGAVAGQGHRRGAAGAHLADAGWRAGVPP